MLKRRSIKNMSISSSFVMNLYENALKKTIKSSDKTQWKIEAFWTFLDTQNSTNLYENIAHIIYVRQGIQTDKMYIVKLEAFPVEMDNFITIEKVGDSVNFFAITLREYIDCFGPKGSGSGLQVVCKLTFTEGENNSAIERNTPRRLSYIKKRYDISSLPSMSSSDAKDITMKTVLSTLLQSIETQDHELRSSAMDFIIKNLREFKNTEMWADFTKCHRELAFRILDEIVEQMGNNSENASIGFQKAISSLEELQ